MRRVILEGRGISKSFGGLMALSEVNIQIKENCITGLIGPNGAGKTTLFNILSGFLKPDRGIVLLQSNEITGLAPNRIVRCGMARSWQGLRLFGNLTVIENIVMGCPKQASQNPLIYSMKKWSQNSALDSAFKILGMINMDEKAKILVKELSYAEQKLVAIGRLLATESNVLLLDEPTSGLDEKTLRTILVPLIKNLSANQGKTFCIVEHSVQIMFDLCQEVFCLSEGRILASGEPDVLKKDERINEVFFQVGA